MKTIDEFIKEKLNEADIANQENLNEDSLDDFDIDGKIAKERNAVSAAIKTKTARAINKTMNEMYELCDKFFAQKGMKIKQYRYSKSDTYKIEYPDLGWGFTYKPNNSVEFLLVIGECGSIDGVEKENSIEFLKELVEFITSEIKYLRCDDDIWKDSMWGIHGTAPYIVRFTTQLKDLK